MAVKLHHQPVASKSAHAATVQVPEDVANGLRDLYTFLSENPSEEGVAEFDTAQEGKNWKAQAQVWAGTQGLKFRQLPAKGGPNTQMRFQIKPVPVDGSADVPANGETGKADKK
jgi:hypothetical protein